MKKRKKRKKLRITITKRLQELYQQNKSPPNIKLFEKKILQFFRK